MTHRSDLTTEIEKALTDEVYDGSSGALNDEQLRRYIRRLAEAAVEVVSAPCEERHQCDDCQTCGVHDGRHDKCCGCYDGVCCQAVFVVEIDWAEDRAGNPIAGPIGPFDSERLADEWALEAIFNGEWNTASLTPPAPIIITTEEGEKHV